MMTRKCSERLCLVTAGHRRPMLAVVVEWRVVMMTFAGPSCQLLSLYSRHAATLTLTYTHYILIGI